VKGVDSHFFGKNFIDCLIVMKKMFFLDIK